VKNPGIFTTYFTFLKIEQQTLIDIWFIPIEIKGYFEAAATISG